MLNGNPVFQYELNKKFGHLRDVIKQPSLDNFTHQSLLHTIKNKNLDLTLVHYTDLDSIRHEFGADPNCNLMLEAANSYYFQDDIEGELIKEITIEVAKKSSHYTLSTHGYNPYKKDYTTVFMASGKGIKKGLIIKEMSLIDEGPTLAKLLGVELKDADGKILEDLLEE